MTSRDAVGMSSKRRSGRVRGAWVAVSVTAAALLAGCDTPALAPTEPAVVPLLVPVPVAARDIEVYESLNSPEIATALVTPGGPTPIPRQDLYGRLAVRPISRGERLTAHNALARQIYRLTTGGESHELMSVCAETVMATPPEPPVLVDLYLRDRVAGPQLRHLASQIRLVRAVNGDAGECQSTSDWLITMRVDPETAFGLIERLSQGDRQLLVAPSFTSSGAGAGVLR